MKKLNLLLSALLALGVVSTALAQDAPARGQRDARQGAGQAIQRGLRQTERPALQRANLKPTLFADLGDECYTPDGMTISDETGMLYLSVPNFGRMDENMVKADSAQGGYLYEVDQEGKATRILEFPVLEKTGQAGPMGLDFGPDGNLYVCDNQYFHNPDYCSRILRVVFVDGKPTQEVQVAVEGLKLANGMTWFNGNLFVSDSYFDVELNDEQLLGSGGVLMFTADEITKAGKDGNPPLQIKSGPEDPHCVAFTTVQKLGRDGDTGADGICIDKNGTIWFGNFGNGYIYALRPNDAGEYKQENVETVFDALNQRAFGRGPMAETKLECCDGMFYDANLDCVYINDSVNNAVWMFKPVEAGQQVRPIILWMNDDSDGKDGLLDQPCEAVVYAGKLLVANFDYPFPGMKNKTVDPPGTISGIDYAEVEKFVTMWSSRPRGLREGQGQGQGQGQGLRPRLGRAANAE